MNYEELLGTTRNYEVGVENPTTDELSDAAVEPANPARCGGASLGGGSFSEATCGELGVEGHDNQGIVCHRGGA